MRRALLALGLLITATAQPAGYFTVSTDRTFAPGEKVSVAYTAQNLTQLEFRLYRVADPVRFFEQLPDAHNFGGQAPPVPKKRTFIEQFHAWKGRTRFALRRFVRQQFGDEEHEQLVAFLERRPVRRGPARFAEAPVLNPSQLVRQWTLKIPPQGGEGRVDVETPGVGLYVLEATDNRLRAATIINVTSLALIKKTAPGRVVVQALDRTTGEPQANVELFLINNRTAAPPVRTDADGRAEIKIENSDAVKLLLVAKGAAASGLALAGDGWWGARPAQEGLATGYIYTDRPIYRPGHKLGWRAILRGEDSSGWKLPAVSEVSYEITNPEGNAVAKGTAKLSDYGTASGEWTIPMTAPLGYYSVLLRSGESAQSGSFQVEEYKKPEYEVKVTAAQPRLLQGATATFNIEARYFFGEPVANGRLKYRVYRSRYWFPFWAEEMDEDGQEGYDGGTMEPMPEATARLDAQGRATITVPTPSEKFDYLLRVEAAVTDEANRDVTGKGSVLATVGSIAINAQPDKWVYAPGETVKLTVEARTYDGQSAAGASFSVQGASGTTNAEGKGTVSLTALAGGSHQWTVTARTPEGRTVTDTAYLWVSGQWRDDGTRGAEITLVPDKKSYQPGDTAKILVVTGVENATVLLGVEGRDLYRSDVRRNAAGSFTYEVPIQPEYLPNVFITAALLKDGQYRYGAKSIKVPPVSKMFQVGIVPSKPQFKPGEPASYRIEAKDAAGKPVAAEFSVGVVDEALYGVAPDTMPGLDKAFYGRIWNRVYTDSSLAYYFFGTAGVRPMPLARARQTLAQMKPPRPTDPRIRKAFPDTALWLANVETDSSGKAEAKFQFPDSITAWRATVRGVTRDTRVGGAVNRVVTRKELILRLAAPRFFTEGDEAVISAIVNNYLDGDRPVKVQLEVKGAELLDGAQRSGTAMAKQETRFDYRVKARSLDQVTLTAKAFAADDADALEIELPVNPYGVKLVEARSGSLTDGGSGGVEFGPARTIDVRVTPSLAGAVFGALDYLATFPYGCTEQTLSSFMPTLLVDRASRELKLPLQQDRGRLQKKIQAGVERLYELQHPDGGWGWWASDESSAFMTAHAIAGLSDYEQLGYYWKPASKESALQWLRRAFAREQTAHPDFRAYLAYALNEPAAVNEMWEVRDKLTAHGLALIGLRVAEPRANQIADRLEKLAVVSDNQAYWLADRDWLMDVDVDGSAEVTAYALKLLTRVRPKSPLIEKAVRWLVDHRNEGYYWSSTKQTAAVVYGLVDYLKLTKELDPKLAVDVKLNGEQVYSKELLAADALSPHPLGVRLMPKTSINKIAVAASGTGRLYWGATATSFEPGPRSTTTRAARGRELRLQRQYFRQLSTGQLVAFDGQAKVGETLVSRVTVSGGDWRYLMIEDPIPASAEIDKARRGQWVQREVRDDRAVYFETYFRGGAYESALKLTRPGKFRVSPARVTPMYQPGVMASSDPQLIEVVP